MRHQTQLSCLRKSWQKHAEEGTNLVRWSNIKRSILIGHGVINLRSQFSTFRGKKIMGSGPVQNTQLHNFPQKQNTIQHKRNKNQSKKGRKEKQAEKNNKIESSRLFLNKENISLFYSTVICKVSFTLKLSKAQFPLSLCGIFVFIGCGDHCYYSSAKSLILNREDYP